MRTAQQLMIENMLVKHYAGSIAYGTNLPTSDVDFRGIFCADPINVRTPFFPIREADDSSEEDTKLYELANFMKLALDCNPNVIETFWVDERHVVHTTDAYKLLRKHNQQLLSSKIAFTTVGYAMSQLKRIKGHNKWINQPQSVDQPQQVDFVTLVHTFSGSVPKPFSLRNYNNCRLVPYGSNMLGLYPAEGKRPFNQSTGALNNDYEGDAHELGTPTLLVKFNHDSYKAAVDTWSHYWEWKENRNKARSALEEQHGYDTKHAMHLVRLMRMGREALEDGVINVFRPDAKELLEIRNGALSYDELIKWADQQQEVINKLVTTTDLPKQPDVALAAELVMAVQDLVWVQHGV